jgi:hypothetical protein
VLTVQPTESTCQIVLVLPDITRTVPTLNVHHVHINAKNVTPNIVLPVVETE